MTGGSDDARPPKDGRESIDDAWSALVEEAGTEEDAVRDAGTVSVNWLVTGQDH